MAEAGFGTLLRRHRVAAGLTQEELAERAGVSARAISDLEREPERTPRSYTVQQLADALDLGDVDRALFAAAARRSSAVTPGPDEELPAGDAPRTGQRRLPTGSFLGALPGSALVAREVELERLLTMMEIVAAGEGRLVLLAGEAGIGKTRLAQEVMVRLRTGGFLVGTGRCYQPQQAVPYFPFLEALETVYLAAPATLRTEAGRRWPYLCQLLPNQIGMAHPIGAGSPDGQQRLFRAITSFLDAIAQLQPLALLLDDLQWADRASLELLQHLARNTRGSRVLLLGTYRDLDVGRQHPLEGALRDLGREGLVEQVELRRLAREGTAALVAATFDAPSVSAAFTDLVHDRTDGNPFFVQQVLQVLVERGDVFRHEGGWDRKQIDEIEVPASVRSVIGQRLSRLAEATQEVLREASVLGPTFAFDELLSLGEWPERTVEDALAEAEGAGLVREVGRDGYMFDHVLTQQALAAELPSRRRRRLHLAAGATIEQLPDGQREGRAAELAWHFLEGDDPERALTWSLKAGTHAAEVFAYGGAQEQFQTAVQLAREIGDRERGAEALEQLGGVLYQGLARIDEAIEILIIAAELYAELGNAEGEMRAVANIGWARYEQARRAEGITQLLQTLRRWQQAPAPSAGAAALHTALATLYWADGMVAEALPLVEKGVELARTVGNSRLEGQAEGRRGAILVDLSRVDEGLEAYNRAIKLATATGDYDTLSRARNNRSVIFMARGQREQARADLERNVENARRIGSPAQLSWSLGRMGEAAFNDGDWDRAEALLAEAADIVRSFPGTRSSVHVSMLAALHAIRGLPEGARELQELAAYAERTGDVLMRIGAHGWMGELELMLGRPEAALAHFEMILAGPAIEGQHRAGAEGEVAAALLAMGDVARANEMVAALAANMPGEPYVHAELRMLESMVRACQGRWEEAQEAFDAALDVHRRVGDVWPVGRMSLQYGLAHLQGGNPVEARARLEEALAIFRRLGAELLVERVERVLAELDGSIEDQDG